MIDGYRIVLASAVGARDGMSLELNRVDGTQIAEVFEDATTGSRTVHLFVDSVPLEAIEWLIAQAKVHL